MAFISDQGFDFVYIPDVGFVLKFGSVYNPNLVLVLKTIQRFTSLWITSIRQLSVTVDGVVTAPPQFVAN